MERHVTVEPAAALIKDLTAMQFQFKAPSMPSFHLRPALILTKVGLQQVVGQIDVHDLYPHSQQ